MKRFLIFAFFLNIIFLQTVVAQTKVWFSEEFNDNSHNWLITDSDKLTSKISGGKYLINNKVDASKYNFVKFFMDPDKDFSLESTIVQTEGNDKEGFGFVLWSSDDKYYNFLIDPIKGWYWIGYSSGSNWVCLNAKTNQWSASDAIKKGITANKIALVKKNSQLSFHVNGTNVFDTDASTMFFNGWVGFSMFTSMKIEIENLVFKQDNTLNLLPKMPAGLKKEFVSSKVNTTFDDKMPYIAPDGKTLYFSLAKSPQNLGGVKDDDIWYSESADGLNWGDRTQAKTPLNNVSYNFVISSTPDNNTLLLGNTYKSDGSPDGGGVSISHKMDYGWSVPEKLQIDNFQNTASTNEYTLSANRKVLLMSIKTTTTLGGKDLYVSFDMGNNHWSEPKNLGNTINTSLNDETPFLAADGVTLYFSSAGHPGYGLNDIFVSKRLDETWLNWSTPQNLGPDINTQEWDAYYTIPASGNYAYMTVDNKDSGLDIVRIKLPEVAKPKPVVLIHGKVFNSKTNDPLQANITYYDLKTHKELGTATSNPQTGEYKIVLPAGASYSFLAKKQNFYSVTDNIDLSKQTAYQEVNRDLFLAPIEVGQTIRLNNIFFPIGEYTLLKESYQELDQIVKLMQDNPTIEILLEGHTDIIGNPKDNQTLSENRVKAVKTYLVSKGVTGSRVQTMAYGGSKPIVAKGTDEERKINRRVEFKILKK